MKVTCCYRREPFHFRDHLINPLVFFLPTDMEGLSGEGDADEAGDLGVDDNMDDLENDPAFKPIQAGSLTALDIFYEVMILETYVLSLFHALTHIILISVNYMLFVMIDGTTWIEKYRFS